MVEMKPTKTEYGSNDSVAIHVKSELSKRFNCTQCESRFRKKGHLSYHIDAKHKGLRHPCLKCSSQFSTTNLLRRHIQEIHKTTCYICNLESNDEPSNKRHIDCSHVVFKCRECEKTFNTRSHMSFHMKKYHSMQIETRSVFECTECDLKFNNLQRLRVHQCSIHLNQWHKCSICGKEFDRYDSLKRHLKGVHSAKSECKKCDFIGYKDQLKGHLSNHIDAKHKGLRHPCLKCSSQFSRTNLLRRHIQKIHKTTCYICNLESHDEPSNKRHIDSSHVVFKCRECEKTLNTRPHMSFHMKKYHSMQIETRSVFECTECDLKFNNLQRLRVHQCSIHLNQWHKCSICGKEFDRYDSLKRHLKDVHSAKSECKKCDFIGYKDQLKIHHFNTHTVIIDHGRENQSFKCTQCESTFKKNDYLMRHIESIHVFCDICNQEMTKERMEIHLDQCIRNYEKQVVSTPNVYRCKFCNYQVTKKAFIKMHLKNIHKSEESVDVDNPREESSQPVDNNINEQSYKGDKEVNQEKGESAEKKIDNQNDHGKVGNFSPKTKESLVENNILSIMQKVQSHVQLTCKTRNLQIFPVKRKVIQEKESNGYLNTKLTDVVDGSDESLKDNAHDDNGTKKKECPECGFSTDDEELYHHHQVTDHLLCYLCGFTSEYQKFIFSHMKAIHNIMDFEEEEEEETPVKITSKCPICFETLPSKNAIKKHHSKVHASGQNFICGKCGKTFCYFKVLLKHLKIFHHERAIDSKTIYDECLVR